MKTSLIDSRLAPSTSQGLRRAATANPLIVSPVPWLKIAPYVQKPRSSAGDLSLPAFSRAAYKQTDFWETLAFGTLEVGALAALGAVLL
jgi:hypothetical protein